MSNQQLLILSLLILSTFGAVKELTKQSFNSIFNKEFEQFTAQFSVSREFFILFYSPQFQSSLEAREIFHHVAGQHERRSIELLKRKGVTQFEEFQAHLEKSLQLVQIDCGENEEVCRYFQAVNFPTFLFINKQNKVYLYQAHMNAQQIYSFISKVDEQRVDMRYLKPHEIKSTGLLTKIQAMFKNQTFIYLMVFLIAPFLFGYFVMAKPAKPTSQNAVQDQSKKNLGKPKQMKKND